jgi:hypothetical protein
MIWLERVLRATALVALALLLWITLRDGGAALVERAAGSSIGAALMRWSTAAPPAEAHVAFDSIPAPSSRDWLAALSRAGTRVTWEGDSLLPSAVTVTPVPDPQGGVMIAAAAPRGSRVVIGDELGPVDTIETSGSWGRLFVPAVDGTVSAAVGSGVARAARLDSLELRPLLVLGRAGWETKFVVAALEERGWKVESRVPVSPQVEIMQGDLGRIDTSRYSAVVLIDTTAASQAAAIARYVRSGGGAIIAGSAARIPSLSALRAGQPGTRIPERPAAPGDTTARGTLALNPIMRLAGDAIPLEWRGEQVAVAARRVGRGRVLQVGYDDTWRWRLTGSDDPIAAHREWWARAVSGVAYAPAHSLGAEVEVDPMPYANLVAAIGLPEHVSGTDASTEGSSAPILFAICIVALLAEWGSRRWRGVA